MKNLFNLIR